MKIDTICIKEQLTRAESSIIDHMRSYGNNINRFDIMKAADKLKEIDSVFRNINILEKKIEQLAKCEMITHHIEESYNERVTI